MLSDLDELILSCRSARAKQYIAESVAAYKVGAFRSSVVAAWIAVTFDFIDKLRDLEATGDNKAGDRLREILKFQGRIDPTAIADSLEFERNLLDSAVTDFEFLTQMQRADLERLREDRNRCAHPSLQSEDEPYHPSAELARYHISNAVNYMLAQPPVQGKAALARLFEDVKQSTFPVTKKGALTFFKAGPLHRARHPLVRNFVVATLKLIVEETTENSLRLRAVAALLAVREMYPSWTEDALKEKLSEIVRGVPDARLLIPLKLMRVLPISLDVLDNANKQRLQSFIDSPPAEQRADVIGEALRIPLFIERASKQLGHLSDEELVVQLEKKTLHSLLDEAVARFTKSADFATANRRGRAMILPFVSEFGENQVAEIQRAILENNQVLGSTVASRIVRDLLPQDEDTIIKPDDSWNDFYQKLTSPPFEFWDDGAVATVLVRRFPSLAGPSGVGNEDGGEDN